MKRILITGGPTNEVIDDVMKITNMSTGSLSLDLANRAIECGCRVTLILNNSVLNSAKFTGYFAEENPALKLVPVETTQDMFDALKAESAEKYDAVIHASAVGDYKPQFTFRMEDMAEELAEAAIKAETKDCGVLAEKLLAVLTDPECKVNGKSTKISSYEPNLTVKLTLTTKLIANLRKWFPDAELIGCKLLDNVTKEHLFEVARKLCIKNEMDIILANDLHELSNGKPYRYPVTKDGWTGVTLNAENGPALLDYAADNWFKE